MKPLIPYLFFKGNCFDAMTFYKACFGGDLQLYRYKDAPGDACINMDKNAIMHSTLQSGDLTLMASDYNDSTRGDNVQLSINFVDRTEIETLFNKLSKNGTVKAPLSDTFWGAYFGMLVDQFGIHWMLNCEKS